MRDYELVMVVSPAAGDEGVPAAIDRVNNFIRERGGEIRNVDQWGRQRLAYSINGQQEAFYVVTQFSFDPQAVRALEGSLDLAEDILRHLVVRLEEAQAGPAQTGARSVGKG